ncbi:leucyl aminopeptidase [Clostridioides sp. ZZV15-6598]|uniref:leucyl aminopeptidase n=1 Tax=Clostridioides sp. ZZV15-6598 TaxID=2811501 RepID=UPI001D125DB1|nr:leucyl aminopeptidase [Clostridioides sp. ZZV15-6598]
MDIKIIENIQSQTNFDNSNILLLYKGMDNGLALIDEFDSKYGSIDDIICLEKIKKRTFLCGLGERKSLTTEKIRTIAANIIRELNKKNITEINFTNIKNLQLSKKEIEVFVEGLILGSYKFEKYKTEKSTNSLTSIHLFLDEEYCDAVENGKLLAQCNIVSRNLINEPANFMYPQTLAEEAKRLGLEYGFETLIYNEKDIEDLNMGAFLSVAKGSNKSPKFIVMKYNGDVDSDDRLGFVGKGITFDSGGYSLKRTASMVDMKTDMGGAGAVIGAMCAIAKNKLKKNVVSVIAACENIISSKAYKPGDIITSMSGKTIEVLNTDCEGRLTLIDAVHYIINKEKVNKVVTIATLTGAAVTAFGSITTPIVSNNDDLYRNLEEAAKLCDEKVWRMPNFEEYRELIVGENADLKNFSGKYGGCITAGLFIGEFVGDVPWVHMDIAGTVSIKKDKGYKSKGATGEGARTLYYLATK